MCSRLPDACQTGLVKERIHHPRAGDAPSRAQDRAKTSGVVQGGRLKPMSSANESYANAMADLMGDFKRGYDLGTNGRITFDRDSLHERQP